MKAHYGWAFPDSDEFMLKELKPDGTYQASHLRMALAHVTQYGCAIDGGAHVGTWSRILSAVFARVIAVEPSADTFEALATNMQQFGCANVELKNLALGATAGRVTMVLEGKGLLMRNTGARFVTAGGTIPCEAIDDWQLPALGFLKLDVEGSEVAVLEGAAQTIARCHPIVLFEDKGMWKRYGQKRDAPRTLLTRLGYRHLATASCDQIWGPA